MHSAMDRLRRKKSYIKGFLYDYSEFNSNGPKEIHESIKAIRRRLKEKPTALPWSSYRTPINSYYSIANHSANFETYLTKKVQNLPPGEKLKVLDVGMGDGAQWVPFLRRHINKVEFHGTTLEKPCEEFLELAKQHKNVKFKRSLASNLHSHYEKNYFDVISCRLGAHHEEFEGVENIVHVLKLNGEATIRLRDNSPRVIADSFKKDIVEVTYPWEDKVNVFHLRKLK